MNTKNLVKKSLIYIDNHIEEKLTIEDISSAIGYSKYHFSRLFKNEMNMSIMEYVKCRKIMNASERILQGEKIIDVAMQYGWETHSGFIKAFKSYFGFTPSLLCAMNMDLHGLGGVAMKNGLYKCPDESLTKEQLFEQLIVEMKNFGFGFDNDEVKSIYELAVDVYAGKKRYSGNEYVTHVLNVALLLVQMNASKNVVYAGMFCDVFRKTDITKEQLRERLHEKIYKIILRLRDFQLNENSIVSDEECSIIKLAERLHNMRTVEYMEETKRVEKSLETIRIYVPIARKLGNKKIMNELDELASKYIR